MKEKRVKKLFAKIRRNQFLRAFFRFYRAADSELTSVAVAYYWLISVFPLLLIVVNILPYFNIPIADFLTAIKDMLPETLYDVVAKVMREVLTQPSTGLLSFSVLSALWTFSKSMNFLQFAFNKAYGVAKSRGLISHRVMSLVVSIGLQILFAFTLFLTMFGHMSLDFLRTYWKLDNQLYQHLQNFTEPLIYALLFAVLVMFYYFLPNVKINKKRYVLPGSVFVILTILALMNIFSVYMDNYLNHLVDVRFFSSIIMVVMMFWFIMIAKILIVGAVLNASIQSYCESGFQVESTGKFSFKNQLVKEKQ
ncbi:ribonuclease BN [Streptococcus sanguinis SK49]|uniref:Ribonuclease BN n=1 Tax=Streptococcus sanguinis SK49 TaxID=888808 RepID=F3UWR2_STRSA|nr:YihY/virulence factor BrkB family protein [Streptococcus sanguinis]EGJ39752.1 ribonuclease BN [Streptococcus sanguinis SK49]